LIYYDFLLEQSCDVVEFDSHNGLSQTRAPRFLELQNCTVCGRQ